MQSVRTRTVERETGSRWFCAEPEYVCTLVHSYTMASSTALEYVSTGLAFSVAPLVDAVRHPANCVESEQVTVEQQQWACGT